MTNTSSIGAWSFYPLTTSFPPTVLPNIAYWNVTNGTWEYQVQVSWPLNWTSTNVQSTVETLYAPPDYVTLPTPRVQNIIHAKTYLLPRRYVLDGNAQAQTATEAFRRIRPNDPIQPDTIIVSIGYPNLPPDSPYADGRYYDYQIPVWETCPPPELPGVPSGGEAFITFLDTVLRPWIHNYFPSATFDRDALYGHSFSGLFTIYTLMTRPELFDVFLSASPFLVWNDAYIFDHLEPFHTASLPNGTTKPALQITYGGYECNPQKRRTESLEAFRERRAFIQSMRICELSDRLYKEIKNSPNLRHIEKREYPFSYHPAVGGNAIADGLDYFLDW